MLTSFGSKRFWILCSLRASTASSSGYPNRIYIVKLSEARNMTAAPLCMLLSGRRGQRSGNEKVPRGWLDARAHAIKRGEQALQPIPGVHVQLAAVAVTELPLPGQQPALHRSEERRVGKECRSGWSSYP